MCIESTELPKITINRWIDRTNQDPETVAIAKIISGFVDGVDVPELIGYLITDFWSINSDRFRIAYLLSGHYPFFVENASKFISDEAMDSLMADNAAMEKALHGLIINKSNNEILRGPRGKEYAKGKILYGLRVINNLFLTARCAGIKIGDKEYAIDLMDQDTYIKWFLHPEFEKWALAHLSYEDRCKDLFGEGWKAGEALKKTTPEFREKLFASK